MNEENNVTSGSVHDGQQKQSTLLNKQQKLIQVSGNQANQPSNLDIAKSQKNVKALPQSKKMDSTSSLKMNQEIESQNDMKLTQSVDMNVNHFATALQNKNGGRLSNQIKKRKSQIDTLQNDPKGEINVDNNTMSQAKKDSEFNKLSSKGNLPPMSPDLIAAVSRLSNQKKASQHQLSLQQKNRKMMSSKDIHKNELISKKSSIKIEQSQKQMAYKSSAIELIAENELQITQQKVDDSQYLGDLASQSSISRSIRQSKQIAIIDMEFDPNQQKTKKVLDFSHNNGLSVYSSANRHTNEEMTLLRQFEAKVTQSVQKSIQQEIQKSAQRSAATNKRASESPGRDQDSDNNQLGNSDQDDTSNKSQPNQIQQQDIQENGSDKEMLIQNQEDNATMDTHVMNDITPHRLAFLEHLNIKTAKMPSIPEPSELGLSPLSPSKKKLRVKDKIVVLDKKWNLPPELPPLMVYWNRCETRVMNENLISNDHLAVFYMEEFKWHEDLDGDVGNVSDKPPFFREKQMFRDPSQEKFVNRQEEKILKGNEWPDGMKQYKIEGHIMIANVQDDTVFFNSKFETGNLRQVFTIDPKKQTQDQYPVVATPLIIQSPSFPVQNSDNKNQDVFNEQKQIPVGEKQPYIPCTFKEYNLYLQDDTNSDNSLTQWFYFSCRNIRKGTIVKFNMLNLMKDDSLYNQGMRPFVYSSKRNKEGDGATWHREGFNIDYFYNDKTIRTSAKTLDMGFDPRYVGNEKDNFKKMSTLSFCYEFKYDDDTVFFTHFAPYSYSDVFRYLCKLESDHRLRNIMRIDHICNSLGKVPMYGLTITENIREDYITQAQEIELWRQFEYKKLEVKPKKKKIRLPGLPGHEEPDPSQKTLLELAHESLFIKQQEKEHERSRPKRQKESTAEIPPQYTRLEEEIRVPRYKKYIFLTSRVHPGETNSQYMLQGCIEFIISDDPAALELRKHFIFKIIPILNPDGVIHGNYRASLMGVDLNRRWKNPSKFLHPTIYYAKSLIKFFHALGRQPDSDTGGVVFSCDMHGHSRNMNVFMYACKNFGDEQTARVPNQVIWSIPENVHRWCPIFSTHECKMATEKDKDATARIVLFKELGIQNSYTLEATFFGSEHFKKPRANWIREIEEPELINKRYGISDERTDVHITPQDLLEVGHDFLRGLNFAQGKPLLSYNWFDEPKKAEALRLKEEGALMRLQQQLEEIQAQEREAARLLAQEQRQREIRERKERKAAEKALREQQRMAAQQAAANGGLEPVDEERTSTDGGATKPRRRKKKKHLQTQHGFGGWDEAPPRARQHIDPASGTAKTTATEGEKRIVKKKVRKLQDARDKDSSVPRGIKKAKKYRPDGGEYVDGEGSLEQLPEIASPERQRRGARHPGGSQSKTMLLNLEGEEAAQVYRNMRNSREEPGDTVGLGDSLMEQYSKYTSKQAGGYNMQRGGQQGATKYPGYPNDGRGYAANANRTNNAFSPRRAGDQGAPVVTNNKMIDLVEQILGGGGIQKEAQHTDQVDIGTYKQNMLFPQYGQGQRPQQQLYPLELAQNQPYEEDQSSSKLRQVSHIMNEIARNNHTDARGYEQSNTIDPNGITITRQPVGVIHAKNIKFSGVNQNSDGKSGDKTPKQGQGVRKVSRDVNQRGSLHKFRNSSIQPHAHGNRDQAEGPSLNGFSGIVNGQVFGGATGGIKLREPSKNAPGGQKLHPIKAGLGAGNADLQRQAGVASHGLIIRQQQAHSRQIGGNTLFQVRKSSHQPAQYQYRLDGDHAQPADTNIEGQYSDRQQEQPENDYDRYKKFELYQRQKYDNELGINPDQENQTPTAPGNSGQPNNQYKALNHDKNILNQISSNEEGRSYGSYGNQHYDGNSDSDQDDQINTYLNQAQNHMSKSPQKISKKVINNDLNLQSKYPDIHRSVDDPAHGQLLQGRTKPRYNQKQKLTLNSPPNMYAQSDNRMVSLPGSNIQSPHFQEGDKDNFQSFSIKNQNHLSLIQPQDINHRLVGNGSQHKKMKDPAGGSLQVQRQNDPASNSLQAQNLMRDPASNSLQGQRQTRSYLNANQKFIKSSALNSFSNIQTEGFGIQSHLKVPQHHYQTINRGQQEAFQSPQSMVGKQQQLFQNHRLQSMSTGGNSEKLKFPEIRNISSIENPDQIVTTGRRNKQNTSTIQESSGIHMKIPINSNQFAVHSFPEMQHAQSPRFENEGSKQRLTQHNQQIGSRVQIKVSPNKMSKKHLN